MTFQAGSAHVLVVPSFDGFQRAVRRQVTRGMPAAGQQAGTAMAGGMAAGVTSAGSRVAGAAAGVASGAGTAVAGAGRGAGAGFIARAASGLSAGRAAVAGAVGRAFAGTAAAGAAAGAATGAGFLGGLTRALGPLAAILGPAAIIGGGFSRLANIEDAEAKLVGLGHSADTVSEIMANALDAVTGTAFGLDEAATLAASLVASGIQPGEELRDVLIGVADAATIGGTSLADMGSIYAQVAAGGRVQAQELNRLTDRGIPALQLLSEHLGVSVAEVRELASAGEIGFAEFAAAMQAGMVDAAQRSGETTRGTLRNVGAAVSRLGARIMEDIFPKIREWGALAIETIDDRVIPAWERTVEWVRSNSEWLTPLTAGIGAMAAAMTAWSIATGAVGIAWQLMEKMIGRTVIGRIILIVGGLIVALITAWQTSDTFRTMVTTAWEAIYGAIDSVISWITGTALPWLQGAWDSIKAGAAAVGDVIYGVWTDYIQPAWDAVAAGAQWLWDTALAPVFDTVGTVWDYTGGWILDVVQNVVLLAWDLMVFAVTTLWDGFLKPIFSSISDAWDLVGVGIRAVWERHIKPAWDLVKLGVQALWQGALKPAFDAIADAWRLLALGIELVWQTVLKPVWDLVAGFITDTIVPGIETGVALADAAWRGIANMFREPINWVINFVWNDGLKAAFDNVARAIGSEARLPAAPTIPRFAKGGRMDEGWKLVGEEGPELIRTGPGWAFTADQTRRLLDDPARNPLQNAFSATNPPHGGVGGWLGDRWDDVTNVVRRGGQIVRDAAGNVVSWVRGGLAKAADLILSPIFNGLGSLVSQWGDTGALAGDSMTSAKDRLVSWIEGKDEEGAPDTGGRNLRGAQPHVNRAAFALADAVGGVRTMQAFNQSMAGGHPRGLAVDFIDSVAKLNRLAGVITQTGGFDRFNYMAWQARLWSPGRGWRPQGRGFGNDPQHRWHLHAEWYDNGGFLKPGMGLYANATGRPEPVLTEQQWDDVSKLAARGAAAGSNGPTIQVTNHYPQAEPTSVTVNRAQQYAAALGEGP